MAKMACRGCAGLVSSYGVMIAVHNRCYEDGDRLDPVDLRNDGLAIELWACRGCGTFYLTDGAAMRELRPVSRPAVLRVLRAMDWRAENPGVEPPENLGGVASLAPSKTDRLEATLRVLLEAADRNPDGMNSWWVADRCRLALAGVSDEDV